MSFRRAIARPALIATALLACNGEDLVLPGEGEAASISVVQGDEQTGRVGATLAEPVVARVIDARGRPVMDVPVMLTLADVEAGEITPETARTAADGTAAFQVILGSRIGVVQGRAAVISPQGAPTIEAPVRFTAVSADAAGISLVAGDGQSAPAGSPLGEPLVVQVADGFGNPIPDVAITWEAQGGGSVSAGRGTTDAGGLASVERTLGPAAGVQRTRALADGLAGSPVTFVHTATAGSAARLEAVSGNGQSAVVGTPVPDQLVVRLLDPASNPVPGTAVTWVVGQGGGTVAPETTPTDAEGLAATRWNLGTLAGSQTVAAVVSGVGVVEFTASAVPGTPPGLRLVTQPAANARRGDALSRQPVVQLVDPSGADLRERDVAVNVSVAAGGGRLRGSLTRSTDAQGRAVFVGLALEGPAGRYTLAFSASGYAGIVSDPIELARSPTTIRITSDAPDPSSPGEAVEVSFSVTATAGPPAGDVTVTADGVTCTATVAVGRCSLALTQPGNRTITASYAGGDEFDPATATEAHTVRAPPPAGPSASASTVTVEPASVPVGREATIRVTVRDPAGNALTGAEVSVAVSGAGNSVSPASARSGGDGVARFTFSSTVAEAKTVAARADGVTLEQRPVVTVTRAATTTHIESDAPDPSDAGEPIEVLVRVRSDDGTPGGSVDVTADGGAACTTTLSGGAGRCAITPATAGRITLTARYAGDAAFLPSSATESHEVRAPAEPILTLRTEPSDEAVPGEPFRRQPEVQLSLEGGGDVRQAGVTVRVAIASGNGTLEGSTAMSTGGDGRARFRDLAITGGDGAHILEFSADGFRSVRSAPIELRRSATETAITRDEPDPSAPGEEIEVRFRVRGGRQDPTGRVTVSAGPGGPSCSGELDRGEGRCTLTLEQEGEVTLTAEYAGDGRHEASIGTEPHRVRPSSSGPRDD